MFFDISILVTLIIGQSGLDDGLFVDEDSTFVWQSLLNTHEYVENDVIIQVFRVQTHKFFERDADLNPIGGLSSVKMDVRSVCHFDAGEGIRLELDL